MTAIRSPAIAVGSASTSRYTRSIAPSTSEENSGAIIDERYNQGGMVADYIVNELERVPMSYFATAPIDRVSPRRRPPQ
jgi:hypothetical protein